MDQELRERSQDHKSGPAREDGGVRQGSRPRDHAEGEVVHEGLGRQGKKTTYDTVSIQVTDLKRDSIDDSVFTYPHDYKVQDMTAGMEAVQQGVDRANKAAAADSAKKKDDDKPSLKKGLKGLLKKP